MYNKNKILVMVLTIAIMFSLSMAWAGGKKEAEEPAEPKAKVEKEYLIRATTLATRQSVYAQCLFKFAELAQERSNNRIKVEVYPDSELGTEREFVEMLRAGSVEMAITGAGALAAYAPATGIGELPYLFESRKQGYEAVMYIWDKLVEHALPSNIRMLAPIDAGERLVASKKPIKSFEDMKGLKIRVPESKMFIGTFKSLGCSPTPVAFSEIYMALQTGLVDAVDGPSSQIWQGKHHEQTKYLVMTKHIRGSIWIVMNNSIYQSYPDDIREIVTNAIEEAAAWQRVNQEKEEQENVKELIDYGLIKTEPDLKPFAEATEAFRWEYVEDFGPAAVEMLKAVEEFKAR